jgi:hypothetical protein
MADNLAQAETPDDPTATDQLDAVDSTNSGTIEDPVAAYNAELEAILNGEAVDTATQGEEPAVEEATEEAAPVDQFEEEEAPASTDADDDDDAGPKRIRLSSVEDRAVAAIAKAKGISLVEAAKIFEGQNPTQHQAAEEVAAEPVVTSADIRQQIAEIEEQEGDALTALNFEEAKELRKKASELRDQLLDLRISESQEKLAASSQAERQFYAEYAASESKAIQFYPDAAKADSPLSVEMARLESEMKSLGDDLYYSPDKPLLLAKAAARNLGILMTNPNKPAVQKTVTNRPLQPASGNARTSATAPAAKLDDAIDGIDSIVAYERFVERLAKA